jgi:hypothetical protein
MSINLKHKPEQINEVKGRFSPLLGIQQASVWFHQESGILIARRFRNKNAPCLSFQILLKFPLL